MSTSTQDVADESDEQEKNDLENVSMMRRRHCIDVYNPSYESRHFKPRAALDEINEMDLSGGVIDLSDVSDDHVTKMRNKPAIGLHFATNIYQDLYLDDDSTETVQIVDTDESMPVRTMESITSDDIGNMVAVDVLVTDASSVYPERVETKYGFNCGCPSVVRSHGRFGDPDPPSCSCDVNGEWSEYPEAKQTNVDCQHALVQDLFTRSESENPTEMPAALSGQQAGEVEAGDRVRIYAQVSVRDNDKSKSYYLDVLGLEHEDESFETDDISDSEMARIDDVSNKGDVHTKLASSIAPHLTGGDEYDLARQAILYQLAGASSEVLSHEERSAIHIGLVGDPGCGKSDFGSAIDDIAPKSSYVSADSASAAGVTASAVQKEMFGRTEWTISGGALVNANDGVCVIDEADKGPQSLQSALNTPLSKGVVEVDKADKDTTLPARTSAVIIANPQEERFNQYDSIVEQFDLPETLWDRLDLVIPFVDSPGDNDGAVFNKYTSESSEDEYDNDFLTKYLAVARTYDPELTDEVVEYLATIYEEIRSESGGNRVSISARHAAALRRLTQASARIRLSEKCTKGDAERACQLVRSCLEMVASDPDGNLDADRLSAGPTASEREVNEIVLDKLSDLTEVESAVPIGMLKSACEEEDDIPPSATDAAVHRMLNDRVWRNKQGLGVIDS